MAVARSGRAYTQPGRSSFSKTIMFEGDAPMLGLLTAEVKGMPLFESSTRIKGKMVDPDGAPVEQFYRTAGGSWEGKSGECGRAFEYSGHVVSLTDGELDAIKGNDDNIVRITAFTDQFSPSFVEKTHMLWWAEDKDVQQYDILLALLRSRPAFAFIGTTIDHGTTKAVVIRYDALTETLVAHVCKYAEALRNTAVETIKSGIAARVLPSKEDVEAIAPIFEALRVDPELDSVADEYAARLEEALAQKVTTGEVTIKAPDARTAADSVPDLMAALKASAAEVKDRQKPKPVARKRKARATEEVPA